MTKRLLLFLVIALSVLQTARAQGDTFKGTVGKYGIVVYIEVYSNGRIGGWCYYTSKGPDNKIPIGGNIYGTTLSFSEYEGNIGVGSFTLTYNKNARTLTGTHYNINTQKELRVNLKQTNATVSNGTKPSIRQLLQNNVAKYPTQSKMYRNAALKQRMVSILGQKKYNMIVNQLACSQLEYTNGYFFVHGWLMHSYDSPGYYFMYNPENDNLSIVWCEDMRPVRIHQERQENVISTLNIINGTDW